MQQNAADYMEFRKEHTMQEIIHYILDFESPPLTMNVRAIYFIAKAAWIVANVTATLGSVSILVLTSLAAFYNPATDQGQIVMDPFGISELICVMFFTVDYISRLGITPWPTRRFVADPYNLIDLITTVPYYIQVILWLANSESAVIRVIFVFRTLRLLKLSRYHPGLGTVIKTVKVSADLLLLFLAIGFLSIVFFATVFFYTENSYYDTQLGYWIRPCPYLLQLRQPNCTEEISPYQSIPDAMYWAVVTITTVGYHSQTPATAGGKAIAAVVACLGVLFFSAPATVLSTNYRMLRRQEAASHSFKAIDLRTTAAMLAQDRLRIEMELALRNRTSNGRVRLRNARRLTRVAEFFLDGVWRPIYEVVEHLRYVYPPILSISRDENSGHIEWHDDFNPSAAQRTLSLLLVLDSDRAREAARASLVRAGLIPSDATENEILVTADNDVRLEVYHEFTISYPSVESVVRMDTLRDVTAYHQDAVPIRFTVSMPHLYPSTDVIDLLKETQLRVTMITPIASDIMDVPLVTDIVMATRFVRELSEIAFHRESDGSFIAYIHESDAAELLTGFSENFVPGPMPSMIITQGYYVDAQVLSAIISSFPRVRLEQVPPAAANSFYRGQHLSIDLAEELLLEVNLSALAKFDELGFGHRFYVEVPIDTVTREDAQFQIV